MAGNPELTIWLRPVSGESFAVRSTEFSSVDKALTALSDAFRDGRGLRFRSAATGDDAEDGLVNLANIVAVRVWRTESTGDETGTGQYL